MLSPIRLIPEFTHYGPGYSDLLEAAGRDISGLAATRATTKLPQIAFDADGVLQLFSITKTKAHLKFYQDGDRGRRPQGAALQHIMEIPGMLSLVTGLRSALPPPILVSSMPLSRGLAIFNAFPTWKTAFLGLDPGQPVIRRTLRESPHVFFAEDLARGMQVLNEVKKGERSIEDFPDHWHKEIKLAIRFLPRAHIGTNKLPVVVALSKPGAPKPDLMIDDSVGVAQALLDFSPSARVVRPEVPWPVRRCFFPDPIGPLHTHFDHQALVMAEALGNTFTSPTSQLIRVPRRPASRFENASEAATILDYRENGSVLVREYYGLSW